MNEEYEMTVETLRQIVAEHGLAHAEFCIGQTESQLGSEYAKPLWAELRKLEETYYEQL